MSEQLDLSTLVDALVERARHADASDHADVLRYRVLADLLGVPFDPFDSESLIPSDPANLPRAALVRFLAQVGRTCAIEVNPFASYMEAPQVIVDLHGAYGSLYRDLAAEQSMLGRDVIRECFRLLVPGIEHRRTTSADLEARGVQTEFGDVDDW